MKNLIILPTYNERKNVGEIIRQIFEIVPSIYILVVDDNSPDGTAALIGDLKLRYPNLDLLLRSKRSGLGNAYKEAFLNIINDKEINTIITMDADSSHDPKYLPKLLYLSTKYDLVVGSRYINEGGIERWEVWRRLLSLLGNFYSKLILGSKISDLTSGFVALSNNLARTIPWGSVSCSGYAYTVEMKIYCEKKLHVKLAEIPIIFRERRNGESKLSLRTVIEGILMPWRILLRQWRGC